MVVRISTIDEVRDVLVKLNINERDVHKVLTSLQMRDNWLQYLSQKISPEQEDELQDGLDEMIRQHSDPPSERKQGFVGESYVPSRRHSSQSSSSSVHRREIHVCDTLGPNPKVLIAHLGTKDLDSTASPATAPKGVSKYYEESDEAPEDHAAAALSPVRSESCSVSHGEEEEQVIVEARPPPIFHVVDMVKPVSPNFCVRVLTAPLNKRVLPSSGLKFFSKSCATRAQQQQQVA